MEVEKSINESKKELDKVKKYQSVTVYLIAVIQSLVTKS